MTRLNALEMIDKHKNQLINPVEMLHWTWLRLVIYHLSDEEWERALKLATKSASQ